LLYFVPVDKKVVGVFVRFSCAATGVRSEIVRISIFAIM
jgi:hypothetical protein